MRDTDKKREKERKEDSKKGRSRDDAKLQVDQGISVLLEDL